MGRVTPSLSLYLVGLHRTLGADPNFYVEVARIADELGIDQLAVSDHVVMGERVDRYPYGPFPFGPDEPWLEPLTMLAAIAAVTKRIRLCTSILIAPLRPAALLAKTVATLDALSQGRVDLGVGIGWQQEEFEAQAIPFSDRWKRTDDTLRACRALWQSAPANFSSATVSFDKIFCSPRPAQARLPIWFGAAMSEKMAARIAEYGDGWLPLGAPSVEEIDKGAKLLHSAFAAVRRAPSELKIRSGLKLQSAADGKPDFAATFAPCEKLRAVGATHFSLALPPVKTLDAARAFLEPFAAAFQPYKG